MGKKFDWEDYEESKSEVLSELEAEEYDKIQSGGLSMNVIIIAAISLLVLVIISVIVLR